MSQQLAVETWGQARDNWCTTHMYLYNPLFLNVYLYNKLYVQMNGPKLDQWSPKNVDGKILSDNHGLILVYIDLLQEALRTAPHIKAVPLRPYGDGAEVSGHLALLTP